MYQRMHSENKIRKEIKIVHISDLHIDFDYVIGSNAECGMAMCCRGDDGTPKDNSEKAG